MIHRDNVVGFEYSFIGDTGSKQKVRIYYEKNLQGDVIGLLDSRGAEIATYSYDAWGNVTDTVCYEGNEIPYNLNHIKYRGYYMDEETDFYYLETRYYDPEICRFINSDDVNNLGSSGMIFGYNLYAYCEGNPVRYTDATGKES
ncbi:MAG: RHS repeat-associated core domain-containing protein [Ruminococcus sp.]